MTSSKNDEFTEAPYGLISTQKSFKQPFSKRNYSRHLTEVKNDLSTVVPSTHTQTFSSVYTAEVTSHGHENVLQNTSLENDSFVYSSEPLTSNLDRKSSKSHKKGSRIHFNSKTAEFLKSL